MTLVTATVKDKTTVTAATNSVTVSGSSPVTEQINGVTIGTVASGGTNNQVIENSASTPIGTAANPSVVADSQAQVNGVNTELIPATVTHDQSIHDSAGGSVGTAANPSVISDNTINFNGADVDTVKSQESYAFLVKLDGTNSGTYNAGTNTVSVTSAACADATTQVNAVNVGTVASGGTFDQQIHDSAGADVGTSANPSVVGDATVTVNGDSLGATGSVVAEGSVDLVVNLDGSPSGSWDGDSWEVTSAACADATVNVNGVFMENIPSGATENIEVRQETGATLVGSKQGQHWRIDDSQAQVNGVNTETIPATVTHDQQIHDSAGADVGTAANPSVIADTTVRNNATPTWSDTVEAEGTLTLGQAKALDSDGATTLLADYIPSADGFMFTCTPGGGACPSVSLAISDTTPNFGDTITLTATASDFTGAITYHFITRDSLGNWNKITQVSDNTYDYVVPYGGTYDIHVICEDGSGNTASDCVQIIAVTLYNKHGIAHAWVGEDVTLVSGLVDSVNDMVGAIDATAASAATRPRFIKDARSELNGMYRAIGGDYLTTTLSTLQDNVTIAGVYDWTQAEDSFGGSYMVLMGGTHATLDAGSRFNIGYLQSTGKHRFNVRTSAGGVGANVQFTPAYGKNIFVLTYNNSTGALRVNFNGSVGTATFAGTVFNSASDFVLLNGDGSLNYGNGWREPVSEFMIGLTDLSDADADQLYSDLLLKYPA